MSNGSLYLRTFVVFAQWLALHWALCYFRAMVRSNWVAQYADPCAPFASQFPLSCSKYFPNSMSGRDIDVLMVYFPGNGELKTGLLCDDGAGGV